MKRISKKEYDSYLTKFTESSKSKQIDILWEALDVMQQYNGRNSNDCIVIAMGGWHLEES